MPKAVFMVKYYCKVFLLPISLTTSWKLLLSWFFCSFSLCRLSCSFAISSLSSLTYDFFSFSSSFNSSLASFISSSSSFFKFASFSSSFPFSWLLTVASHYSNPIWPYRFSATLVSCFCEFSEDSNKWTLLELSLSSSLASLDDENLQEDMEGEKYTWTQGLVGLWGNMQLRLSFPRGSKFLLSRSLRAERRARWE